MTNENKIKKYLDETIQQNASDLHIATGFKPTLRIDGRLVPLVEEPIITPDDAEEMILAILTPEQKKEFLENRELDFAFNHENKARFRGDVFFQRGYMGAAFRNIPSQIKTIEALNLPTLLYQFTKISQGFVLVVGPAGHGKSSTLAALLDEINHTRTEHLITIEDPIEYVFENDKSIVSQREVGIDTPNFHSALKLVLRQDPAVIMIGEMRDRESIATALTAAETGHLVFSTLHTNSASQTVDRIIDSFPGDQQDQVKTQLASSLVAIISERLVPRIGGGRYPAVEIMINDSAIRNLIRERKTYQIDLMIETSIQEGMISLNRSLAELIRGKKVTLEDALFYSPNPAELKILLERL